MANKDLIYGSPVERASIRVVIYTRVSHDRQGGKSVAEQEKFCREHVALHGWQLIRVYSDNDKSAGEGSKDRREEWAALEAGLLRDEFDLIMVWEPSRATRDQEVWNRLAKASELHGVMLCVNGQVYDPADPDERFMLDMFFALARREQAMTRKRVRRTIDSRAEEGMPAPGKAPFGYTRIFSSSTRLIEAQVPDEVMRRSLTGSGVVLEWTPARVVHYIFEACDKGTPPYAIAQRLNEVGIPNPRTIHAMENHPDRPRQYEARWNPRVVRTLVRNKAYLGTRLHKGRITREGRWVGLATPQQFANIALQFVSRTLEKPKRVANQIHLLSGLMRCATCDRTTTSSTSNGLPIYRCSQGHAVVNIEQADAVVVYWILTWLSNEENLSQLRAQSGVGDELSAAQADLLALQAEQKEWEALAPKISATAMANFFENHSPKLRLAEEKVATLGVPPVLKDLVAAREPWLAWNSMVVNSQRSVIDHVVELRLAPAGRGRRSPATERVKIARRSLPPA